MICVIRDGVLAPGARRPPARVPADLDVTATVLQRGGDTAGRLMQTLSDADDESHSLACEALAEFGRRSDLDRVTVPFLLGPGEHDGVVPPARAQQDADAIAGSRLQVFAGCGHLPPAESPNAVAQALTELFAHDEETR